MSAETTNDTRIVPITVPKWGMAMDEGTLTAWHVAEGAAVAEGQEILDLESTKIANAIEAKAGGILRRRVVAEGEVRPVGALLGVIAPADVPDAAIEAFVAGFKIEVVEGEEASGPASSTVAVAGRAIAFVDQGEGDPPIVLVHGFGGDRANWMFNQAALAAKRRTIALDLPGHGQSAMDVGDGSRAALAATLLGFLDALGIARAHLVGHSLGGAVSLATALDTPGRVASLTLVASAGLGPEIDGAYLAAFLAAERRRDMTEALKRLFGNPEAVTRAMVEEVLKAKRMDGAQAALTAIAGANFPGGRQDAVAPARLAALATPALVIWGERDAIIPAAHAQSVPGAQTLVVPGAGHMVHLEAPGPVGEAILRHVAG